MIGSTRQVRVFAYCAPADLRKGYDGLSGLVHKAMKRNPISGDLYLFINRRRHLAKVLLWDGTGLCIYSKRLERGQFADLWWRRRTKPIAMTTSELTLLLEGNELIGRMALSPPPFLLAVAEEKPEA